MNFFSKNYSKVLSEKTLKEIQKKQELKKILKSKTCRVWYWGIRITTVKNFLTLYFKCLDSKGTKRKHLVRIILDDYPEFLKKYPDLELEKLLKKCLIEGNVRLHCTCEDFLYGGYAYIANLRDYHIVKEPRFPKQRNPALDGAFCKHCSAVTNRAPLFLKSYWLDLKKKNFKKSVRIKTGNKIYVI